MSIKFFVLLLLALLVLGLLIGISFNGILSLLGFMPEGSDLATNSLLSSCLSKSVTYGQAPNEVTLKSFCCYSADLNGDGAISNDEYCVYACPNCGVEGKSIAEVCADYLAYSACQ